MNGNGLAGLNVVLYALASLAAFGSLNKQRVGSTRPCIIGATLLLALGAAAQALGQVFSQWAHLADTATAGGILVLLIASQRQHTWILERWANPVASVIALAIGIVCILALLAS